MTVHIEVSWVDGGREPRCQPDPEFPDGREIDISQGVLPSCQVDLPHPAKRCGVYVVQCGLCGNRVAVTTAGRPDDPRSIRMHCYSMGTA